MKLKSTCLASLVCAALFGAAGCGSTLPPDRAEPRAAIRAATELGAQEVPEASLHLALAREQLDRANRLVQAGEKQRASWLLVRADADAELAIALTKEQRVRAQARDAREKIRELSQQTQPSQQ